MDKMRVHLRVVPITVLTTAVLGLGLAGDVQAKPRKAKAANPKAAATTATGRRGLHQAVKDYLQGRCPGHKVKVNAEGTGYECTKKSTISAHLLAEGAFLKPNAVEILLVSVDVARKTGEGWADLRVMQLRSGRWLEVGKPARGMEDFDLRAQVRRRSGTDLVFVCTSEGEMGEQIGKCYELDPQRPTEMRFEIDTRAGSAACRCGAATDFYDIPSERRDLNGDGVPDLVLRFQAEDYLNVKGENDNPADGDDLGCCKKVTTKTRVVEHYFLFDGERFTAAGKKTVEPGAAQPTTGPSASQPTSTPVVP